MTFFFDNDLSPILVSGLRAFGEDVQHLRDSFPANTPDTEWLPEIGRRGWFLVTRDKRIRTRPHELDALLRSGVGAFVFVQKHDPNRWEWVELVVRRWREIRSYASSHKTPFVVGIPQRGTLVRLR